MYHHPLIIFLLLINVLIGQIGIKSVLASQDIGLDDFFPRVIAMKIGGEPRILVREYENPKAPLPNSNIDPLAYLEWKKVNDIYAENQTTYELVFSPKDRAWFRHGKKLSMKDFPFFKEGMRYVWTRDFRLLTSDGNHASIDNGDYVLCAGTMHFDDDGLISQIDNATGHMCAHPVQLLHMVADLAKMGAISLYTRVSDYQGKLLSPAEVESAGISVVFENLRTVEAPLSIQEAYEKRFNNVAVQQLISDPDQNRKISQIVFEVLEHDYQELFARGGSAGMNPDYEQLEKLKALRPHQTYYEKIIAIRDHGRRIDWQQIVAQGGGAMPLADEAEKKAALEHLLKLINERPHPVLYDEIVGVPVMPEV